MAALVSKARRVEEAGSGSTCAPPNDFGQRWQFTWSHLGLKDLGALDLGRSSMTLKKASVYPEDSQKVTALKAPPVNRLE